MKKFLALFLIFTMLLPAAAYGYYTEDTRYATTSVNVRSGPGTKYSIVGGLNRGDIVKRTGESGKWIRVAYNGIEGYVYGKYLSDTDLDTLPVYPILKTVKVRSSPGRKYKIIGKIKKGTMKPVKSITTVNGKEWLEGFCDGKWGYISAEVADKKLASNPEKEKAYQAIEASGYFNRNSSIYVGIFGDLNNKEYINVRVTRDADTDRIGRELTSIISSFPGVKIRVVKSQLPSYANKEYLAGLGNIIDERHKAMPSWARSQLQFASYYYDLVNDIYTVQVLNLDAEKAQLFKQYISDWEYIRLEYVSELIPKT
jgi:uncharacterized protein YraI